MLKKRMTVILFCAMTLVLAGCGSSDDKDTVNGTRTTTELISADSEGANKDDVEDATIVDDSSDTSGSIVFDPVTIFDNDSYSLTADSVEVDEDSGYYLLYFTFVNKTDTEWHCTFDKTYYNGIKSTTYASETVAAGESAQIVLDNYDRNDIIGLNYIESVYVYAKIYDSWTSTNGDCFEGFFYFDVGNTSSEKAMTGFDYLGNIDQTVLYEDESVCVTAMDYDPEFPSLLLSTEKELILYIENISDEEITVKFKNFKINDEEIDDASGICSLHGGFSDYAYISSTEMNNYDEITSIGFEIYLDEVFCSYVEVNID